MGSPTMPLQAGEGRQRWLAAASENSALVNMVSGAGMARIQADDTLSLCLQDQAALVLFGLTSREEFVQDLSPDILPGLHNPAPGGP